VFESNLNNKGPDNTNSDGSAAPEGMRISNLGEHEGKQFDMIVNSLTPSYVAPDDFYQWNNVYGYFGYLIVGMNSHIDARFTIVETGTNTPMVLPKWYFTFFDLDKSVNAAQDDPPTQGNEKVAVKGFSQYFAADSTGTSELKVTADDPEPGFTSFESSVFGDTSDNPKNPMNMNDQQKGRAVTFEFLNTATFDATYTVSPCVGPTCTIAREVYFAGKSQLATDPCGMPPSTVSRVVDEPPTVTDALASDSAR